jgi:ABC-type Zn uptake system ZnuABC Zn-binding protein ZnuA
MKKLSILLFFLGVSIICFAQNKPKVVATATMIWDMTKVIGGELVDIQCIVPIGGDPHLYDPTPRDAKLVASAQLILKNGLTFEGWLNELIENSGTKAKNILVTKNIQPITSQTYKNSADPHAWMDVQNGMIYAKNIKDALVELAPEHKKDFEKNYQLYIQELEALDQYIIQQLNRIPKENRILITSHDAFQYFGRRYGVQLEAILGTSTDAEAQTSDIRRLNQVIRERKVPAVFIESTINPKLLKQLAEDNDIIIGGELYADSIGDEESPAPNYIEMLRHNTDTIVKGLLYEKPEDSIEKENIKTTNYWLYGLLAVLFLGGFLFVVRKLNN